MAGESTGFGPPLGLRGATQKSVGSKNRLEQASKQQLDKDTQKPIIEVKEGMAPKTDVQKIEFAGIEKIGIPYKTYPLKATFIPYIKVAVSKRLNRF